MMRQLARLVGKNLSMGIDGETASVGELTPKQLSIAATTAFNRGIEVRNASECHPKFCVQADLWPRSACLSVRGHLKHCTGGVPAA